MMMISPWRQAGPPPDKLHEAAFLETREREIKCISCHFLTSAAWRRCCAGKTSPPDFRCGASLSCSIGRLMNELTADAAASARCTRSTRSANMSKAQALRDLVMERLVVAADDIFALFERTFAEYEEEFVRSKQPQPRTEPHKEDAPPPPLLLNPDVPPSPEHMEDDPAVHVKQEEDHSFEFSAAYSVKSEENMGILLPDAADEDAAATGDAAAEERRGAEEEPGCSLHLRTDSNEQNYDTDDSEDWRPADVKKSPKSAGLKKDSKRGRPARTANVLLDKNTASERNCEGAANGGKRKAKQPKCSVCGKSFQSEGHFKKHWLAHCGQKPFKCLICDKAFRNKANYRKHAVIHEDDKPFICQACDRGFSQKCHLQAHMRIHTGEKPFSCPDCGVRFRYQRNIYRHITAVHKGEKPFSCPFCDKAFSQKSPFIVHMRTHTGEKPFSCSVCKKGFIDNCHLKKHAKTHEAQHRVEEEA